MYIHTHTCVVRNSLICCVTTLLIHQPLYRDAWDKEKANVNVPADTPVMLQSKLNAIQISNVRCHGICFTECSCPHLPLLCSAKVVPKARPFYFKSLRH